MMDYKIQALNGFQLYTDQVVTVFRSFYESEEIDLDKLTGLTGMNRRKTRLLLNFLADIGLNNKRTFTKTELGQLIFNEDGFLQDEGTIWFFHYMIASNEYIVVWNRLLNELSELTDFSMGELYGYFDDLEGQISEYSFKKHIRQEVSTVLKTYTETFMKKLNLIEEDYDNRYLINKNPDIDDAVVLACIYQYREKFAKGATALPIKDIVSGKNGVARIFTIEEYDFRESLERMKNNGWISIESRGNLDQIRLKDGDNTVDMMSMYYKERR
jgi:hypothetical protein